MSRWPLWSVMVVLAVAFGGSWYLSTFIFMPSDTPAGIRALGGLITGALFGVFFGLWLGRQRRGIGAAADQRVLGRAIRRGELPADADVDQWRQALTHYQQLYRRQRRLGPAVFVVALVLEASLAVAGRPLFWLAAAFFVVMLVVTLVQTPKVLRNTAAMLTELDRRERTSGLDGR
ncbi:MULTISPECIES: hypothetical protein [unclassified Curtobacterium]|uniref:hypothetical protein n=1 Tax=unclassified Curtobacterium TaxID=257496 RepID=UPI00226B9B4F|nr:MULTISPECIES: hypothetical protein [unclassified Curtobacterium]